MEYKSLSEDGKIMIDAIIQSVKKQFKELNLSNIAKIIIIKTLHDRFVSFIFFNTLDKSIATKRFIAEEKLSNWTIITGLPCCKEEYLRCDERVYNTTYLIEDIKDYIENNYSIAVNR